MASTAVPTSTALTREHLRTFHISGRGLEDYIPSAPLRPLVADRLPSVPVQRPLLDFYDAAVSASRGEARKAFIAGIKLARQRLAELLVLDEHHQKPTTSSLSSALGARATAFFNTTALADALREPPTPYQRLDPDRRSRIEAAIETLGDALRDDAAAPVYWLFRANGKDCFIEALEFCDQQLEKFTAVLRALRIARLEAESAFDPDVHDEMFLRFDWQSSTLEELLALRPVVVVETAERLAELSLTSFGRLLRSGRPVHILITSQGLYSDNLSGYQPDFGFLAMAYREAFVLQSSPANPEHLTSGLAEMTRSLRPAVAIVSNTEGLETQLLYLSGAFPLFRYDPDRGESTAERFQLVTSQQDPELTAAHAAAVSGRFLEHFRVVPANGWDADLMELGKYLEAYGSNPPLAVPYIELANQQWGVISRELVNLCRDRRRAWKIFEEVAPKAAANIAPPPPEIRADVDSRRQGATEAIHRMIAMLSGTAPVVAAEPAPSAAAPPPDTTDEMSAAVSEDPYIDSFLCTSCNDCFKISPRVFAYDANKQAYIADASAGTYAELVKAAEGCPAKCIHPGMPRTGDATATPQVLAKAVKFR